MAINKARRRKAEMTTRHGQLKVDRKAKPQKIFMDDLAIMENLTIVYTMFPPHSKANCYLLVGFGFTGDYRSSIRAAIRQRGHVHLYRRYPDVS